MKIKKLIIIKAITLIFAISLTLASYAHNDATQRKIVGGRDTIGWHINENAHTWGTALTFKTHPSLLSHELLTTLQGAAKWKAPYSVQVNSNSPNTVGFYSDNQCIALAMFRISRATVDSNRHFTKWEIEIHRGRGATAVSMAHEFGHAFGLMDLFVFPSGSTLMFAAETRTATEPTAADLRGASVITGIHGPGTSSPHIFNRFLTNPVVYPNLPRTHHMVTCSVCHGDRVTPTARQPHVATSFSSVTATHHVGNCPCGVSTGSSPHRWSVNRCVDCGAVR
jgi:hypothetical protein